MTNECNGETLTEQQNEDVRLIVERLMMLAFLSSTTDPQHAGVHGEYRLKISPPFFTNDFLIKRKVNITMPNGNERIFVIDS